jgi:pimeloyl-ACP methyl ester carboxylesterase
MPFINLGSIKLYYEMIGQGRPVVFVNGWTMSSEYWLPLVEKLKDKHLCLLFDGRGFGRSRPLDTDTSVDIEDYAEELHDLISHLGLKDVNLVGHGLGAWASILCARRHPQDLVTLTAIAPEGELEEESKASETPSFWRQASLLLKDLASLPLLRNLVAWRYRRAPEPYRTRLCEDFALADRRAAFHMLASCMGNNNQQRLRQALTEISTPVLLARGSEDRICSDPLLRLLFDLIRSGRMATVRGCGHLPMIEFTDEFSRLLAEFFSKNGKPTRSALVKS